MKNSAEYDVIKENLKAIEREHRKNQRDHKSNKNKIKKNQSKIKEAQDNILANEKLQEIQKEVIKKQEIRVEEFENKLKNIK